MSRASIPYLMADRCSGSFWGVDVGVFVITNHRDVFCVSHNRLGANRFAGCDPEHTFGASATSLAGGGCLCIGCLEKRIGRRMTPADFPDHPFKALPGTPRLLERQGRHDPLGDFSG
jgi:hypothetical protein